MSTSSSLVLSWVESELCGRGYREYNQSILSHTCSNEYMAQTEQPITVSCRTQRYGKLFVSKIYIFFPVMQMLELVLPKLKKWVEKPICCSLPNIHYI